MDDIITHARELGKKIAAHERTRAFMASARAVAEDKEAQSILGEYQQAVHRVQQLEASGKPIEVDDKRALAQREAALAGNEKLKAMMKHQADYLEMMHRINQAIDEAVQQ